LQKSQENIVKKAELVVMKKRMAYVLKGINERKITRPLAIPQYKKGRQKMWRPPVLTDRLHFDKTVDIRKANPWEQAMAEKQKFLERVPQRCWNLFKARETMSNGPETYEKPAV